MHVSVTVQCLMQLRITLGFVWGLALVAPANAKAEGLEQFQATGLRGETKGLESGNTIDNEWNFSYR